MNNGSMKLISAGKIWGIAFVVIVVAAAAHNKLAGEGDVFTRLTR